MASKKGRQAVQMSTAIDLALLRGLRDQARKEDRTLRAVIERALAEYFKRHK